MEEVYDNIERYLAGELSPEELHIFEANLHVDPQLAREVELHRKLQTFLGDQQALALRQNLEKISTEFSLDERIDASAKATTTSAGSKLRWLYGLFGLILLGALAWFLLLRTPRTNEPAPTQPLANDTIDQQTPAPAPEERIVEDSTPIEQPATPEPSTQPEDTKPAAPPQPDRLAPNPVLEALLDPEGHSQRYQFELQGNAVAINDNINLIIEGTLLTAALPKDDSFELRLFDNLAGSYPGAPLFTAPLNPQPIDEDQPFAFAAKKEYLIAYDALIELPKGRYYYQIQLKKEKTVLYTGSFAI